MSVRIRLTLWYTAVLCLGLALFAGAVLWQTDRAADATLTQTLARRAQDVAADLRLNRSHPITLRQDAPDESARQPGEATLWIRVLDARGRVVVRQGPPLPGLPTRLLSDTQAGWRDDDLGGGQHVRLLVQPVRRHGRRIATVQVITTTAALDAARRQLLAAMGLAGGVIALVAALGGLVLADRVLHPVDRITRLAAGIGAGDLHRRVGDAAWGPRRRPPDDELGRLGQTFDAMLARLEEADERRRRLTADAAHELGTPIATIASAAEIALRYPRRSDEYRAVLQHMLDESRHMGRLVDDLLLLARADAGRLPLEHEIVELDEVCRQVVRAYEPLARERGIAVRACLPREALLVMGDEGRLGQVVRNLLDNALHYTPPGGTVTVTLDGALEREGTPNRVILRIRDTGPGIAAAERARVFERFHRADASRIEDGRRVGGSGLGLAICQAIVRAHGGQIQIADDPPCPVGAPLDGAEHGAEVVVTLPGIVGAAG